MQQNSNVTIKSAGPDDAGLLADIIRSSFATKNHAHFEHLPFDVTFMYIDL